MLAGMKYSTGDYVGILDADLQHSPELIPEMLSALEEGYEIAAARRVDRSGEGKVKACFLVRFIRSLIACPMWIFKMARRIFAS